MSNSRLCPVQCEYYFEPNIISRIRLSFSHTGMVNDKIICLIFFQFYRFLYVCRFYILS